MGITLQGHTFTDSHGIGTPNYYGGYCHEFGATSLEALPQVWYMDRFGISNYGGYGHEFDILSARGSQGLHPTNLGAAICTLADYLMRKTHFLCCNADYLFLPSLSSLSGH